MFRVSSTSFCRSAAPKRPFPKMLAPIVLGLSGTKIASQNRSDHGGRKRARSHSAAEIAGFLASAAAKKSLAASDFWGLPQNRRKIAATTAASRRSRAISRPQRPRDTKCSGAQGASSCSAESQGCLRALFIKKYSTPLK